MSVISISDDDALGDPPDILFGPCGRIMSPVYVLGVSHDFGRGCGV